LLFLLDVQKAYLCVTVVSFKAMSVWCDSDDDIM
jgi:hypothetical protein